MINLVTSVLNKL